MIQIEKAIDNFDFERVQKTMTLLNWTYWDTCGVPTINNLIGAVRELYQTMVQSGDKISSTGGFEIHIYEDSEIKISFVLTEAYSKNGN